MGSDDIDTLVSKMKPPSMRQGGEYDWSIVENTLIKFPDDYKSIVEVYGSGSIGGFLWFLTPFTTKEHLDICIRSGEILSAYLELKEEFQSDFPGDFPYKAYPHIPGLFPFIVNAHGNILYWLIDPNKSIWTIVVSGDRCSGNFTEFNESTISLIINVIDNNDYCEVFSDMFPNGCKFISEFDTDKV